MNPYESPRTVSQPREVNWSKMEFVCFSSYLGIMLLSCFTNLGLMEAKMRGCEWYYSGLHGYTFFIQGIGGFLFAAAMYAKRKQRR